MVEKSRKDFREFARVVLCNENSAVHN